MILRFVGYEITFRWEIGYGNLVDCAVLSGRFFTTVLIRPPLAPPTQEGNMEGGLLLQEGDFLFI